MEELGKTILGYAAGSIWNFEEKKQNLKRILQQLEGREADVITELECAESSSGKKRRTTVKNWLINVARIRNEFQSIEQEEGLSRLSTALGSRVETLTEDVIRLIDEGGFEGGLLLDANDSRGDFLLTTEMVGQKFHEDMHKILAHLANGENLRIGIYGMGGMGKTMLATHIHNKVLENTNTFGNVYWVTVSQDCSIKRLQDRIAKAIGLDYFDEDDEKKRAAKLAKAFGRKCKCILILDDLWNHFSTEEVGVPLKESGCKLLLTSRSLEVCRRMECKVQIKVKALSDEESRRLFMEKLGCEMPLPQQIQEIAKSVVRECDGLPLGIITVARSMSGVNDVCEWRNALGELKQSESRQDGIGDQVFRVLRFSYNSLKDPDLEKCFLFCALFPEDFTIRRGNLIDYFIAEGIIGQMTKRQEQYDKGHAMLNKLENVCLLEGEGHDGGIKFVKMHDLIRDMALQIMKSDPYTAMVESGKQWEELPEPDHEGGYWRENVVWVSFYKNHIREIPSQHSPKCPNLRTLLFQQNILKNIADSFFVHLHGLKILDVSGTRIQKLPDSIASLENLTALLVEYCYYIKYLPSLANLKSLKKLDLRFSGFEEVPEGLEFLHNLTHLNLLCAGIVNFPCGILSKLSRLQYLGFPCRSSGTSKAIAKEIACLPKLETLLCWFQDFGDYNSYVLANYGTERQQLIKYHIIVSPQLQWNGFGWYSDLNLDFQRVEFKGNKFCEEMHVPSEIQNPSFYGDSIEDRRDLGDAAASPTTIRLPLHGTFSNLKIFRVEYCLSIKKLFHPALMTNLQNLEELLVFKCFEMEEIIAAEEGEGSGPSSSNHSIFTQTNEFILPKLRVLSLHNLTELKSICSAKMICNSLQKIEVINCKKLENIPLSLPLPSLQQLKVYPKEWWESVEWEQSTDKTLLQPLFCISDDSEDSEFGVDKTTYTSRWQIRW